mmetsp:Transcript_25386/g.76239  ORF Transcript_25386/g.76239 Transcript_25386/m.76239 type:complete len:242 (-) Transcript_25386:25-750(-)
MRASGSSPPAPAPGARSPSWSPTAATMFPHSRFAAKPCPSPLVGSASRSAAPAGRTTPSTHRTGRITPPRSTSTRRTPASGCRSEGRSSQPTPSGRRGPLSASRSRWTPMGPACSWARAPSIRFPCSAPPSPSTTKTPPAIGRKSDRPWRNRATLAGTSSATAWRSRATARRFWPQLRDSPRGGSRGTWSAPTVASTPASCGSTSGATFPTRPRRPAPSSPSPRLSRPPRSSRYSPLRPLP